MGRWRGCADGMLGLDVAQRFSQHLVARAAVTLMIHDGVYKPDERDASTNRIADRRLALAAIPAVHALVGEAHAAQNICSASEPHLGGRHLKDVGSSALVRGTGEPEEAGECLTVVAIADDTAAGAGRNFERDALELSTGASEGNIDRHGARELVLDLDEAARKSG